MLDAPVPDQVLGALTGRGSLRAAGAGPAAATRRQRGPLCRLGDVDQDAPGRLVGHRPRMGGQTAEPAPKQPQVLRAMRRVRFGAFDDGPMRPYYLLRPDGPLWNEGRTIVGQELREPAVYFAVIEQLASGEKEVGEIASALRKEAGAVSKCLTQLSVLRLVRKELPHGASPSERGSHWILDDPFLRFWFRFVFPYQADLEAGLAPMDLYRTEIEPDLADHGRWWGNARNDLRRNGTRTTEEIDIVGTARKRVTVVGEAKWTTTPLGVSILRDLEEFKIPALAQAGFKIAPQVTPSCTAAPATPTGCASAPRTIPDWPSPCRRDVVYLR